MCIAIHSRVCFGEEDTSEGTFICVLICIEAGMFHCVMQLEIAYTPLYYSVLV